MEQVIDLDAAALAFERRRAAWQERGWTVGPLTWADGQYAGPYPYDPTNWLNIDRSAVRGDYSLGVVVRHAGQEGELILYAGAGATSNIGRGWTRSPSRKHRGGTIGSTSAPSNTSSLVLKASSRRANA